MTEKNNAPVTVVETEELLPIEQRPGRGQRYSYRLSNGESVSHLATIIDPAWQVGTEVQKSKSGDWERVPCYQS